MRGTRVASCPSKGTMGCRNLRMTMRGIDGVRLNGALNRVICTRMDVV